MWEPLQLIVYGYAIHPLTPSRRDTRFSNRNRLSTVTEASADDPFVHRDVVSLEVGDEVYAFEKYTPRLNEPVEGLWYRGCVTLRILSIFLSTLFPQICCLYHSTTACNVGPPRFVVLSIYESTCQG